MTTQIGASVFVDPSEITHSVIDNCPIITFGPYPTVNRVDVHLRNVAGIDAVIAELVALKQEMDPPVITSARCLRPYEHSDNLTGAVVDCDVAGHHAITDDERTCPEYNPDGSGEHCHRGGDHGVHEDANGETWRTDGAAKQSPRPADLCTCGHIALNHHLNQVAGELQYCNECARIADCAAFSPADAQALVSTS